MAGFSASLPDQTRAKPDRGYPHSMAAALLAAAKRGDALEVERLVKSGSRLHHTANVRA
jgi:hypothetical protein